MFYLDEISNKLNYVPKVKVIHLYETINYLYIHRKPQIIIIIVFYIYKRIGYIILPHIAPPPPYYICFDSIIAKVKHIVLICSAFEYFRLHILFIATVWCTIQYTFREAFHLGFVLIVNVTILTCKGINTP